MRITSEDAFLALIDRRFPVSARHVPLMRGDDAAILEAPDRICLTTDLFVENVHFRTSYFTPREIGHKALAVNISDAAAMGAAPIGFSLGLAVPPNLDEAFFDGMLQGMAGLAGRFGLPLTGGDLSAAPILFLSVTLWAKAGPSGRFLTRTARPGDRLFVCGELGLARAGLAVLEERGRAAIPEWPGAAAAHLAPEPRVAEGLALADTPGVRGLMDVSDGLARDLPRLLGPDLGADVMLPESALNAEVLAYAARTGVSPALAAFAGGEDYALLGAASPEAMAAAKARIPGLIDIGAVRPVRGLRVNGEPAPASGFDHFSRP